MKENIEGREREAVTADKNDKVTIIAKSLPAKDPSRERTVTLKEWEKLNAYEKKRGSINWELKEKNTDDSNKAADSGSVENTDQ